MEILSFIEQEKFYVAEDKDIICTNNTSTSIIAMSQYQDVVSAIDIDKQLISDACFKTSSEFVSKYKSKVKVESIYSASELYRQIRNIVVNEKLPIKELKKQKSKSVSNGKGSRKDQVKKLLSEGYSSPTEIANIVGSHPSYISQLIKKLQ